MTRAMKTAAFRERGLSLIELLIAMTLGLATVGAAGWVYLGAAQTYRSQDGLARMQEGARAVFELISYDLRMAGNTGCSYTTNVNVVNNFSTTWYKNLNLQPLSSVEKDGSTGTVTEFSDALRILHADNSKEYLVSSHNTATSTLTLSATHDITPGTLLVATDCVHYATFQAVTAGGTTLTHTAGGSSNTSANLGVSSAVYGFPANARIYRVHSVMYYVANNAAGIRSLYRQRPIAVGGVPTLTTEELIEGVEDMQVSYSVDTTATADGAPDFVDPDSDGDPYLTAAQFTAGNVPGATAEDRWARAVSARVTLLMRSVDNNIIPISQRYTYNGSSSTPTDRRLRKVFTHVVKLRNR